MRGSSIIIGNNGWIRTLLIINNQLGNRKGTAEDGKLREVSLVVQHGGTQKFSSNSIAPIHVTLWKVKEVELSSLSISETAKTKPCGVSYNLPPKF